MKGIMVRQRFAVVALAVATIAGGSAAIYRASSTSGTRASSGPTATSAPVAGSPSSDPATSSVESVDIKDFAFAPATITVKPGQTVSWTNNDDFTHSIKSSSGAFDSPDIKPHASFTATFSTSGDFPYICGIHASMAGHVVVGP